MDEKRLEELKPLVDAMRELPHDERVKAIAEFKALGALGKNLDELSEQCDNINDGRAVMYDEFRTLVRRTNVLKPKRPPESRPGTSRCTPMALSRGR